MRSLRQAGVGTLELAVSASLFFGLVFGIIEFGRYMLTVNLAAEATRMGARLAAVCTTGPGDTSGQSAVRERMRAWIEAGGYRVQAGQEATWLAFTYLPAGCTAATCTAVEARISGFSASLLIPIKPLTIGVPASSARVLRESLASSAGGATNPACSL